MRAIYYGPTPRWWPLPVAVLLCGSLAFGAVTLQTPIGRRTYNVPTWDPTCHPTFCFYKIDAACAVNGSWARYGGVNPYARTCEGTCANGMEISFQCPKSRRTPMEV